MAATQQHPFSFKVILMILTVIAIPLIALAVNRNTDNRSRASGISQLCKRCESASCSQCSNSADGWRCKCSGYKKIGKEIGFTSCVGVQDASCKMDRSQITPVKRFCQSCSTGACGQCSKYAAGWRCSCTGATKSGYTSCVGVQDASCGESNSPKPTQE